MIALNILLSCIVFLINWFPQNCHEFVIAFMYLFDSVADQDLSGSKIFWNDSDSDPDSTLSLQKIINIKLRKVINIVKGRLIIIFFVLKCLLKLL